MGVFGSIGKALGGVGKALTPGLGGGFNPVKNVKNAGKALGGAPGAGAIGGALGAAPGGKAIAKAIGISPGGARPGALAGKVASAKGSLAATPALATPDTGLTAPDTGLSAAGPALAAGPAFSKKSIVGAGRALRGGRR